MDGLNLTCMHAYMLDVHAWRAPPCLALERLGKPCPHSRHVHFVLCMDWIEKLNATQLNYILPGSSGVFLVWRTRLGFFQNRLHQIKWTHMNTNLLGSMVPSIYLSFFGSTLNTILMTLDVYIYTHTTPKTPDSNASQWHSPSPTRTCLQQIFAPIPY
jgi:hypothetical protein